MSTGIQPSARQAVWATLLGVSEAMKIGMSARNGSKRNRKPRCRVNTLPV